LTDEALANMHFETLADGLDQIGFNTLFHWWLEHN